MAVPIETVVKQLEDSGIVAAGKLENFVPPKAHPTSVEELVAELVKQNHLTRFQAQHVNAGKTKSLILGSYTILDKIGAGGMGQVFKALHRRMDRTVAIKMLPPAMTKDAAAAARFEREVRAAAKLSHPNIVAAHDADQANGVHFLVMEYVEGKDLSASVKKNGPFSVAKSVNYILQAARGLEFAHKKGVVHRDIKPANLLLDSEGTVKILDMGLARIESDGPAQTELTGTGTIMGTVDYMSPEQALNTKHADHRADIYSLGCSLYYLIAGKAAYGGETAMEKLMAHQNQPIPSLRDVKADVPEQVEAVFKKMVAKKIENRYQTMTEVVADLEQCQAAVGASTSGLNLVRKPPVSDQSSDMSLLMEHQKLARIDNTDDPFAVKEPEKKKPRQAKTQVKTRAKSKADAKSKLSRPVLIGLVAAGLLGIVALAGVIFMLQTKDGTLIVQVNQPDVVVQVLDGQGKVEISEPGGLKPISISVVPGKHRIRVEKDGFVVITDNFEIESGGTLDIKARLVPTAKQAAGGGQQAAGKNRSLAFNDPTFQQWMKTVATLTATQQVAAVAKKLQELNPGFDGKVTPSFDGRVVTRLDFVADNVADLSPLKALSGLKFLNCRGSALGKGKISDLSPLRGLQLTSLDCSINNVSDLSPLAGMPLTSLTCIYAPVRDLAPLRGMPLEYMNVDVSLVTDFSTLAGLPLKTLYLCGPTVSDLSILRGMPLVNLYCYSSRVTDLSPLAAMPLSVLSCKDNPISDPSPLAACKGLRTLDVRSTKVGAAQIAALQKALPSCKIDWDGADKGPVDSGQGPGKPWNTPAFQQWVKATQALPAEKQIEAVSKKLMELNTGFDGKVMDTTGQSTPKIENGVVIRFQIVIDNVTNISPMRALIGLQQVQFVTSNSGWSKSKLADLSPLEGMKLTKLLYQSGPISELSQLRDANLTQLTDLTIVSCPVSDVSALHGMRLTTLTLGATPVSDIRPLEGMPLTELYLANTQVSDLSPLKGMKLTKFFCGNNVIDLSPLRGMPLTWLSCEHSKNLSDVSPLEDCKDLKTLIVRKTKVTPAAVAALQKALPDCKIEWDGAATAAVADMAAAGDGWLSLFNGRNLNGWSPQGYNGWSVANGAMVGTSAGQRGWLMTDAEYADCEIQLEYKLGAEGNSGIFLGAQPGAPVTGSDFCEVQLLDDAAAKYANLSANVRNAAVFGKIAPSNAPATPAGQWHRIRIACFGKHLRIELNGRIVIDKVVSEEKLQGHIGLQLFPPATVEFRNISLRPLDPQGLPLREQKATTPVPALKKLAYLDPAFQAWVKATQALPAEKQIEAVSKKLMERNPGFDGVVTDNYGRGTPKIENGVVTKVGFFTDNVTDISPVQVWVGLRTLNCSGSAQGKGRLSDLSPLKGMTLTSLTCGGTLVSDLSPLEGMPLTYLICGASPVADLSPLKEMPLTHLNCSSSPVADLSPLQGMPLTNLDCYGTRVSDLSPLKGMPLTYLSCGSTKVSDLSPLAGMRLTNLYCYYTPVSDLSPLAGMILTDFHFSPTRIVKGLDVVRQMKSIKTFGIGTGKPWPPDEFWKKYDAGEFGNPPPAAKLAYLDPAFQKWVADTQKLPAEKQIEAVSKKLMELNPGFDGKVTPKLANGVVAELKFDADHVTDISPVRALAALVRLQCGGSSGGSSGQSKGRLADLSPLRGMKLTYLRCGDSQVSDLSPLVGMPITELYCGKAPVVDLSPLRGLPLAWLQFNDTAVADLSPLTTCKSLGVLQFRRTKVTAASVAALQKALPNCKIDWDGEGKK